MYPISETHREDGKFYAPFEIVPITRAALGRRIGVMASLYPQVEWVELVAE
jgi:hypothetical protein